MDSKNSASVSISEFGTGNAEFYKQFSSPKKKKPEHITSFLSLVSASNPKRMENVITIHRTLQTSLDVLYKTISGSAGGFAPG